MPPRERKPALAALAVLLILGGALATTLLVLRSGDRVSAIRITEQIGAGQPFTAGALEEVQVADTGVDFVSWSQREQVLDTFAAVTILPGTLLTSAMGVRESAELGPGKAMVGLALKPGQLPTGLRKGDRVQVVYVPARGSEEDIRVLAHNALVHSTGDRDGTGSGGRITVIVDTQVSPVVLRYASSGEVAVAELPGAR